MESGVAVSRIERDIFQSSWMILHPRVSRCCLAMFQWILVAFDLNFSSERKFVRNDVTFATLLQNQIYIKIIFLKLIIRMKGYSFLRFLLKIVK